MFTAVATFMYCIAFIVLLAGFGYCAGNSAKCDARVAAGVRQTRYARFARFALYYFHCFDF